MCYDMLVLGIEWFLLFFKFDVSGWLIYWFVFIVCKLIVYLSYMFNVFLGCMVDVLLENLLVVLLFDKCYEIDMVEVFKVMVLVGYGVVFLFESVVWDEVVVGWLVCVEGKGGGILLIEMEIWLYCEYL